MILLLLLWESGEFKNDDGVLGLDMDPDLKVLDLNGTDLDVRLLIIGVTTVCFWGLVFCGCFELFVVVVQ